MIYATIFLRNVRDCYTWHSQDLVNLGDRVQVKFRGQSKLGIVVSVSDKKPTFKTQPVIKVLNKNFIQKSYLTLAQEISAENFCPLSKVLTGMIPADFLVKIDPVKRQIIYKLAPGLEKSDDLVRGKKQIETIEIIKTHGGEISAEILRKTIPLATIKSLIEKNIITKTETDILSAQSHNQNQRQSHPFTDAQQNAFDQIKTSDKPVLLFGVTGSGKTEIYKRLALETIEKDKTAQVLFLLPEISLTPQLIEEFRGIFGNKIAIWHSDLSAGEKVQEWARIQSGAAQILIGTRSAMLIPMRNPQLIILDEEHEWTYKNEFNPRFWTHDVAEKITEIFRGFGETDESSSRYFDLCPRVKLLFGSATPRLESWLKCKNKIWNRVDLPHRVHQTKLPNIQFIDLKNEAKKGNYSPLSERLIEAIETEISAEKQVILFLNKRGFAGSTMCKSCGHFFECPHCSGKMKFHQNNRGGKLLCHVCGLLKFLPDSCPECQTEDFVFRGWGTQQLESALAEHFPRINTIRADRDTVTGRYDFGKILDQFHAGEAQILLGTQMISKGLDFERVGLVGIIQADVGLSLPDTRAEERVFQLLSQVSGRAGRRHTQGKIMIQTYNPEEPIFGYLRNHDTTGFLENQEKIRGKISAPPFTTIAKCTFSDPDKTKAFRTAQSFYAALKPKISEEISLNFAPAFFPKSHGKYHFHVFIQMPEKSSLLKFLQTIEFPEKVKIDINPSSVL